MKLILKIFLLCLLSNLIFTQPSITWQKLYNSSNFDEDLGYDITVNANYNEFVIAGGSNVPYHTTYQLYILKINLYGDTVWSRLIDINESGGGGIAGAIATTFDGGYVITGQADSAYAIKLSNDGNIIWRKTYNGIMDVRGRDIENTSDGGFIFTGRANYWSAFAIKINSNGIQQWQYIDTTNTSTDYYSVTTAVDGGYILAGNKCINAYSPWMVLLTKFSINGNKVWEKSYNLTSPDTYAKVKSIKKINNGYIISGMCNDTASPYNSKPFFAGIDLSGNKKYLRLFDSNKPEEFDCMNVINNNRLVFVFNYWEVFDTAYVRIVTCDTLGNIINDKKIISKKYALFHSVLPLSNQDIIFVGDANFTGTYLSTSDIYVLRTDGNLNYPPIGVQNVKKEIPKNFNLYQNYPNPFNSSTNIKYNIYKKSTVIIKLYNLLGQEINEVLNEVKPIGNYEIRFNSKDLSSGIYFYKMVCDDFIETKKMIILK